MGNDLNLAQVVGLGVQDKTNNQSVESQDFCENEDQHHRHKQPWLVCISTDALYTMEAYGMTQDSKQRQGNGRRRVTQGKKEDKERKY